MRIAYYHASEYGNGAKVAEEFRRIAEARGATVRIHHVRDVKPKEVTTADLYLFSSPGRFGKPIGGMRKFLKKVDLPPGARYAIIVTELNPQADKTGEKSAREETGRCQQVIPAINEVLQSKGLTRVAEDKIFVTGMKGPLEEGWRRKVEEFAKVILSQSQGG